VHGVLSLRGVHSLRGLPLLENVAETAKSQCQQRTHLPQSCSEQRTLSQTHWKEGADQMELGSNKLGGRGGRATLVSGGGKRKEERENIRMQS